MRQTTAGPLRALPSAAEDGRNPKILRALRALPAQAAEDKQGRCGLPPALHRLPPCQPMECELPAAVPGPHQPRAEFVAVAA